MPSYDDLSRDELLRLLGESETQKRNGVDGKQPAAIVSVDEQQRIARFNPAAEAMFGLRATEAIGQPLSLILPGRLQFRATDEKAVRNIERAGTAAHPMGMVVELSGRRADGTEFPVKVSIVRAGASGAGVLTLILRDAGARNEAEHALHARETELAEAQRLAHIGSWYWDAQTDVTVGSDELLRIYGFDPATETMPNFREQRGRCYPIEDWERVNSAVQRTIETGIGYELDVRAYRNGTPIWITTRSEAVRNAEGKIVALRGTVQDITERKHAEEALRASEQRFRGLVEQTADGIFVADREGNYTDVNRAGAQMLGYTSEEICRLSIADVIAPEEVARIPDEVAQFADGAVVRSEWRFRRKDGSFFLGEVTGRQLPDGRLQGVLRDITERRRAEDALRDREAFLGKVMDASLNGIYIYDLERGANLFVNRQYTRLTGYTLDDINAMSGSRFFALFHPEDAARVSEHMTRVSQAADGEELEVEYRFRTADGRWIWCLSRDSVFARNARGAVKQLIGTFIDLTQRKQAEVALRDSEARFRELVQNANSAIVRWAADGTINFFNEYAQAFFGWPAGEAIGKHVSILVPKTESTGADLTGLAQDIVRHPERYMNNINENVCRDGRRVWMTWTNRAISDADGQVIEVLAIGNDITAQKTAEDALREADRRKDEFLATLAHELRNPLTPIRNAAFVLGRQPANVERVRWAQGLIERQVTQLTRLVDDLLDVARIVHGKPTLKMGPVVLSAIVHQAVETVRPSFDAKHHRFEMRLPASEVTLHGDSARLAQVIVNLLDNAAKYTPDGGHIRLDADVAAGMLEVRVRDDGMGIRADLLPRVFDLYRQGAPGPTHPEGGLGIGLTLVRSLVEMHGGQVSAASAGPGQGATFTIRLPVEAAATGAPAEASATPSAEPGGMRVLLVEDDAAVASSTVVLLELLGYTVRAAESSEAAMRVLQDFRPRLVLLDIYLPGEDGYAIARRIRQLPGGEAMLLVALTGYGHDEARRRADEAGFDRFLTKPIEPNELIALLDEAAQTAS
ncbi:MAG: PAS domain S-box protein [Gemmatimonadota bacterium]